jgi:outer membrane receptor protein involved in Fe transport
MASDPPLNQVVTKTWEGGLRGNFARNYGWSTGLFSSTNYDDLQFISAGGAAGGYFKNVGETRRRGLEASLAGSMDKFRFGGSYTYINAEFITPMTLPGNWNSSSTLTDVDKSSTYININSTQTSATSSSTVVAPANSQIQVSKGDKIPLIPDSILKAFVDYQVNGNFNLGADAIYVAGSFVRGNENNKHQPGTVTWNCAQIDNEAATAGNQLAACNPAGNTSSTYKGSGRIPGYATMNLFASYKPKEDLTFFARINNVFDRQYYTAGALGHDPFVNNQIVADGGLKTSTVGDTLVAPGAPRSAWIGMRWDFGGVKKSAE